MQVLNLIITGIPSILWFSVGHLYHYRHLVLNLIITGLPSILTAAGIRLEGDIRF